MQEGEKLTLIIDASNLLIRNMLTKFTKTNSSGLNVTGIYGFLRSLFAYLKKYYPDDVYIVWDIGRDVKKKKLLKTYKKQRDAKSDQNFLDNFRKQRKILIDLLKYFPFKEIILPKTEGDTIIAYIAKNEVLKNNSVIIISTDKDFYQLLVYDNVLVFNPRKKKYIELYDLKEEFKIKSDYLRPSILPFIRAILGDVSDNIEGIKGLGNKFCEYLLNEVIKDNDFKNIDEFFNYIEQWFYENKNKKKNIKKGIERKLRLLLNKESREKLQINYELMNLINVRDIDIGVYLKRFEDNFEKDMLFDEIKKILDKYEIGQLLNSEIVKILHKYIKDDKITKDEKEEKLRKELDKKIKDLWAILGL